MTDGRRRYRAGTTAPAGVVWSLFLLLMAAAFVAIAVREHRAVFDVLAAGMALLALWWLLVSLNGLRPVRLETAPDLTLSVPTFSVRRGFGRRRWVWHDVVRVELHRMNGGYQFPYWGLRVVDRHGETDVDSLTCSVRRRDPERSRAGRAVAEISERLGCAGPW